MKVETHALIQELHGVTCRCNRPKGPGKTFCYRCFNHLPHDLQRRLYSRVGEGYEAAYAEAVNYLEALKVTPRHVTRAAV